MLKTALSHVSNLESYHRQDFKWSNNGTTVVLSVRGLVMPLLIR